MFHSLKDVMGVKNKPDNLAVFSNFKVTLGYLVIEEMGRSYC